MSYIMNYQVKKAGLKFTGHFNLWSVEIQFENFGIEFPLNKIQTISKIFDVFGIDPENGVFFEDIEGKYCRIAFDENDRFALIGHIVKDIWVSKVE